MSAPTPSCACRAGEGACTAELYRAEVLRLRREREQLLTVLATLNSASTSPPPSQAQGETAAQRSLTRLRLYRQAWRARRSMSRELARLALELDPTAPRAWSDRTESLDLNAVRPVNRTDETDPPAEETPAFSGET